MMRTNKQKREDETKVKDRKRRKGKRKGEKVGGKSRKEKGKKRGKKQEKAMAIDEGRILRNVKEEKRGANRK